MEKSTFKQRYRIVRTSCDEFKDSLYLVYDRHKSEESPVHIFKAYPGILTDFVKWLNLQHISLFDCELACPVIITKTLFKKYSLASKNLSF